MIWYAGKQFEGAIFDLDGTVLDSMGVWEQVDIRFLKRRGLAAEESYLNAITPMGFKEAAEYTIRCYHLPDTADAMVEEWFSMAEEMYGREVGLKPHAKEYLEFLKENQVKIAAATSSEPVLYERALKNNGIWQFFDAFARTSEVGAGKENPAVYELAAQKIGVAAERCMVFEDIVKGIRSAGKIGCFTVGVWDAYSEYEREQIQKEAGVYIRDYRELEE